MRRCALASVLLACGSSQPNLTVRVADRTVILECDEALRALELDLEWDASLSVKAINPGPDVARLNLVRANISMDKPRARVVLTDTRKLRLPRRGVILEVEADGDGQGQIRITSAMGANDGPVPVPVSLGHMTDTQP